MRPFVLGAKVSPLGCSRPLQRVIVDFAADQPFAQARAKLQEHYGFAIGESTIQRITFAHAEAMYEAGREELEFPEAPGLRKPIVVETDGGMVPIVEPSCEGKTSARARRCLGGRRSCRWRTRKGAGRRFMRAGSRAERERPGAGCFAARFAPASGRTPGSTRSATARRGSSGKSRSNRRPGPLFD